MSLENSTTYQSHSVPRGLLIWLHLALEDDIALSQKNERRALKSRVIPVENDFSKALYVYALRGYLRNL